MCLSSHAYIDIFELPCIYIQIYICTGRGSREISLV